MQVKKGKGPTEDLLAPGSEEREKGCKTLPLFSSFPLNTEQHLKSLSWPTVPPRTVSAYD